MPPRTGPRGKRRPKIGAPRHFAIIRDDTSGAGRGAGYSAVSIRTELVVAHHIELDNGHLVLRDQAGTIIQIMAAGEWREIRPATMADMRPDYLTPPVELPTESPADYSGMTDEVAREQASLVNENDPVFQLTRKEEADRLKSQEPFVPSSPEEAQRILMELERRLRSPEGLAPNPAVTSGTPDYQDPPDAPPPTRKD